jgi:molybdopterin converting factor small subunit
MVRPVRILLFATARTAVGRPEIEWIVPATGVPARKLAADLATAYPALGPILQVSRLVRNGRHLDRPTTRIRPGDEFAVHPPYGGG